MTALLLALVLGTANAQSAQDTWGDSVEALRVRFGKAIETRVRPTLEVRYCPDNTCDAVTGGPGAKKRDVADFALLYIWSVSDYIYLGEWRKGPVPPPVKSALRRQTACSGESGQAPLGCALQRLAKSASIQLSSVRFDEGVEAITRMNLEDLIGRSK